MYVRDRQTLNFFLILLYTALSKVKSDYEDKIKSSSKTQDKMLFKLAWQIQELEEITTDIRQLVVELKTCMERVQDIQYDICERKLCQEVRVNS